MITTSNGSVGPDERRRREREWSAEFERRAAAGALARTEREKADEVAARVRRTVERRAGWARGERGHLGEIVEVAGPVADGPGAVAGEPVRIAVAWRGRFRSVARAFRPVSVPTFETVGEGFLFVVPYAVLFGLYRGTGRLVLTLTRRPAWAVVAAVGPGRPFVVQACADGRTAAEAAAALADRVEQEGAAAVLVPR